MKYVLVDKIIAVARAIKDLKGTAWENKEYPDSPTPENWKAIVEIAIRERQFREQL
jgi:hypothetical protein